ncbi:helix-turn-helix transcriptional regulator [uncultured Adlercreutzia sp.]|uniref:helix-turn-helix transcriptional regulator n=1 Tax=uncultured Adlercreutzia sp. TaxID=875803 RepID=UPI0025A5BFF6|nr:helix-turn-helix transcriptional regulator [uncultured Adlercreutzia sp.]
MKSLRQIRVDKGVTKAAICRHLSISKPTYDAYEADPGSMRVETAKQLAKFLGVELQEIFFATNSK